MSLFRIRYGKVANGKLMGESSFVLKGDCAVITGGSFTGVTVICKLNGALSTEPSFTLTTTVRVPLKFSAGATVVPVKV